MSCNLNIVKNFRVSRTLFSKEDGSPTLFYSASPSDALREIVENGGGLMTDDETDDCIKLCETRNDPEIKDGYLPMSYIKHCVMRNLLIGEQVYRSQNDLEEIINIAQNGDEWFAFTKEIMNNEKGRGCNI